MAPEASGLRERLRHWVEESTSPAGRIFDLSVQFLIVVSLVSFSLETLPNLSPSSYRTLRLVELITVALFSGEYLLRLFVARRPLRFVTSFFGLVDLLAVLPFFLTGLDMRGLRALRLLRLVRIFKLVRYSRALQRFHRALRLVKEELVLFFFTTCLMIFLAAIGIYYFENPAQPEAFSSVFSCLWWAVTTLTTVGYGDVYPVTTGGRFFTFLVLMIGLGIIAAPTGIVASALSEARRLERVDDEPIQPS